MEKYYRTDGINSYIVLAKYDIKIDCFDLKVLNKIKIDNLLGFEFRGINQDRMIYYRINGLEQYVTVKSGGIDYELLRDMLDQLLKLIYTLKQYMLRPENLVMDTDAIFVDTHSNTYKFIYMPDYEQPVNEQFRYLTEQMLKLVDHKDRRAVNMIYDIYDIATDTGYYMDAVASYIKTSNDMTQDKVCKNEEIRQVGQPDNIKTADEKPKDTTENKKDMADREDLMEIVFSKKEDEDTYMEDIKLKSRLLNSRTFLLIGIVATGIIGVVFAAMQFGQDGHIEYVKPLMCIVLLMAILCFIYIHKIHKNEGKSENMYGLETKYSEAGKQGEMCRLETAYSEGIASEDTRILKIFGESTSVLSQDEINKETSEGIIYLTDITGKKLAEITKEDIPYILGRNGNKISQFMKDTGISRKHAKIYEKDDGYYIEDMNSTNGTFVNDMEIVSGYPVLLSDGDIIRLGETIYVVQI